MVLPRALHPLRRFLPTLPFSAKAVKGDDWTGASPVLVPASMVCGCQPVHDRHLHIHEDQIIVPILKLGDADLTVIGQVNPVRGAFQIRLDQYLIVGRVFDQQDRNDRPGGDRAGVLDWAAGKPRLFGPKAMLMVC